MDATVLSVYKLCEAAKQVFDNISVSPKSNEEMDSKKLPKHLPKATGKYVPGFVDLMEGYGREGLLVRIYYPSDLKNLDEHSNEWPNWLPPGEYLDGFGQAANISAFFINIGIICLNNKYIKIPMVESAPVNSEIKNAKSIVFSHGLGGTRFLYSSLCCELASHGFVVIALEHRDGSASTTFYFEKEEDVIKNNLRWISFKKARVGKLDHYTQRRDQVLLRSDECIKALKLLQRLNHGEEIYDILTPDFEYEQFKDKLDLNIPIMMGHSFGGATALLTLAKDHRFRFGVILDSWMFPIKNFTELPEQIHQPLLFINTETFHIEKNLEKLNLYANRPHIKKYTIRKTTHESQTDTVFVIGYCLNLCKKKINKKLGLQLNNSLILSFLEEQLEIKSTSAAREFIEKNERFIYKDLFIPGVHNVAKKIPKSWVSYR